ncbi:hypothetical protein N5C39_10320 [Enterobacter bugandensis]|uniref:Uncharacterized protein n=1 Tax=Enterobacter bugandensis TaxID=881260 RepID=A0AA42PQE5_9ENTR|nr:hypothetical protein [Enterobacter bugandensis]MDH1318756.1 hypothetical protein [Enterobacter bugandensis]
MGKNRIVPKKPSEWALEEISIHAEHLYYLLQTLAENYYKMEDAQKFSLIEIAWNFSGDIDGWINAEEVRRETTN